MDSIVAEILLIAMVVISGGAVAWEISETAPKDPGDPWTQCATPDDFHHPPCRNWKSEPHGDDGTHVKLCRPLTATNPDGSGTFVCRVVATTKDPMNQWH